ncbi:DUF1853 family protein [Paraburkholderia sp. Ac-20347]|uniref:DUF1853 family protein n=1 Tax=Paraburkholderia sp. Ac-20347 TaxID=2703892 RepID=UPI001F122A43|nr:DUF1853 family protein [Paraburkholderia sp. Ac-20347]
MNAEGRGGVGLVASDAVFGVVSGVASDPLACYTDAAVRDLAWLLLSADLLRPQPHAPLAQPCADTTSARAVADWLVQLDRHPAPLHAMLDAANLTRLGRYAETLLGAWLTLGPAPRLVAAGLPLRHAGRTLGECDFLVETADGHKLHWELAVKCYLHADADEPHEGRLADFVGPNLRDRFDWKFAHLLDHQLRLTQREEFAALGLAGPWLAQMFVKGWLFYRADRHAGHAATNAPELAAAHGRGWWVTHADWADFAARHDADGWSVLPRLAWLAPRRLDAHELAERDRLKIATNSQSSAASESSGETSNQEKCEGGSADEMSIKRATQADGFLNRLAVARPTDSATLFANLPRKHDPVMVAAFVADGVGGYIERSRGFIVPDDWPERASAFARQ